MIFQLKSGKSGKMQLQPFPAVAHMILVSTILMQQTLTFSAQEQITRDLAFGDTSLNFDTYKTWI